MLSRTLIILLLLSVTATANAAAVYKWSDGKGGMHYDDLSRTAGKVMTQADVKNRQVKASPDWTGVVPAAFALEVQQRCEQSRERLAGYRGAKQLYGRDPDGNRYRMSAAQAGLLIAETERDARKLCAADAPRLLYASSRVLNKPN